jgi:hypothetical protein
MMIGRALACLCASGHFGIVGDSGLPPEKPINPFNRRTGSTVHGARNSTMNKGMIFWLGLNLGAKGELEFESAIA